MDSSLHNAAGAAANCPKHHYILSGTPVGLLGAVIHRQGRAFLQSELVDVVHTCPIASTQNPEIKYPQFPEALNSKFDYSDCQKKAKSAYCVGIARVELQGRAAGGEALFAIGQSCELFSKFIYSSHLGMMN